MERRGLIGVNLALFIAILVATLFFLAGFFFFESIRFTLIGIGLMIGSGVLGVNIAKTRTKNKGLTAFAFVLFFSGFFIISAQGFGLLSQEIFGGQTTWSIDNVQIQGQNRLVVTASVGVGADTMVIDFTK